MSVVIRHAVPTDFGGLSSLRDSVIAEGEYLTAEPGEYPESALCGLVLVAIENEQAVGMVEVQPGGYRRTSHVGQLQIMIRTQARGRGIGRLLMQRAIDCAGAVGMRKLSLAVYTHNRAAITLYHSLGFIEEGRRKAEYIFPDGSVRGDVLMALFL